MGSRTNDVMGCKSVLAAKDSVFIPGIASHEKELEPLVMHQGNCRSPVEIGLEGQEPPLGNGQGTPGGIYPHNELVEHHRSIPAHSRLSESRFQLSRLYN